MTGQNEMMMMKKMLSRMFLAACCLAACADVARACGCEPLTTKESKKTSEVVFTGAVIDSYRERGADGEEWRVRLSVEDFWKGDPGEEVIVYTSGECMVTFEPGKKYLVFAARQAGRGRLITEVCRNTAPLDARTEELAKLGKPKQRRPKGTE